MIFFFFISFSLHYLFCSQIPKAQEEMAQDDSNDRPGACDDIAAAWGEWWEQEFSEKLTPNLDSVKTSRPHGVYDDNTKQQWVTEIIDEIEKISQKIESTPDDRAIGYFAERLRSEDLTQVIQDLLLRPLRVAVFFINLNPSENFKYALPPYFPEPETIEDNEEKPVILSEGDFVNSGNLIRNAICNLTSLKQKTKIQEDCDRIEILVKKLMLGWSKVVSSGFYRIPSREGPYC
jgi:hypothetical protein